MNLPGATNCRDDDDDTVGSGNRNIILIYYIDSVIKFEDGLYKNKDLGIKDRVEEVVERRNTLLRLPAT